MILLFILFFYFLVIAFILVFFILYYTVKKYNIYKNYFYNATTSDLLDIYRKYTEALKEAVIERDIILNSIFPDWEIINFENDK